MQSPTDRQATAFAMGLTTDCHINDNTPELLDAWSLGRFMRQEQLCQNSFLLGVDYPNNTFDVGNSFLGTFRYTIIGPGRFSWIELEEATQ